MFLFAGVGQTLLQSFGYQPYLADYRWSTDAYSAIFDDPAVRASMWLTLRVSVLSTLGAAVLGTVAALLLRRLRRGRGAALTVFQVDLAVPHLVGALCMTLLLGQSGLVSRFAHTLGLTDTAAGFPELTQDRFGWAIIAEYVWKETPFLGVVAFAAVSGIGELENAARSLGAGRWQRLRHVTLPALAPPVAAASALVLAFATGSYEVPYLLGRPYPATLPVVAFDYFRDTDLNSRPRAMAVSVLITAVTVALLAVYLRVMSRLSRRAL